MIDALVGFVAVLRHHGLDVGTDRTLAAARSLAHVDLADRAATQRALRITLVAHRLDEARFDDLFDRWFDGRIDELHDDDDANHVEQSGAAVQPSGVELTLDTERRLHASSPDGSYVDDPSERIGVATTHETEGRPGPASPVIDPGGDPVAVMVDGAVGVGAASPGHDGLTTRRAAGETGAIHLGSEDGDLSHVLDRLAAQRHRRLARLHVVSPGPAAPSSWGRSLLANPFDAAERRLLRSVVDELRPQLTGMPAWRHRPGPAGELDLRRTLRRAATTAGTPIDLRYRSPAPSRASVLVLLDTSLSVRPTARLMLHLAHRLRAAIGRVRVLAFIDRCVDVTDVIRHADLAVALGRLLDDAPGGPLDPARPSDYGAAMRSLWARYAGLVRPTTTVIVLGDGRSNGRDPAVASVAALTERCRRTVWLTPDPPGAWGFGHGEMTHYADTVDVAWTVRTLDDLSTLAASGQIAVPRAVQGAVGDRWRYT